MQRRPRGRTTTGVGIYCDMNKSDTHYTNRNELHPYMNIFGGHPRKLYGSTDRQCAWPKNHTNIHCCRSFSLSFSPCASLLVVVLFSMRTAAGEQITWIDGFGNVVTQGITYLLDQERDMRRFTARSVLRMTPTKDMHNRTIVCQAQNTVDKAYRTAAIRLEVSVWLECVAELNA